MGIVDIVIIVLVAAAVVAVSVYLIKQKKEGKSCYGNCAGCSQSCHAGAGVTGKNAHKK